jgi:hypothetical protein
MINEEDIYTCLLDGESADNIAKEFTDALNAAVEKYEEAERERKREEEAAVMAKAKHAAKRAAATKLVSDFLHFIGEYYPSFGFTAAEVDAMEDDSICALTDLLLSLLDMEELMPAKRSFKLNGKDLFRGLLS